MGNIIRSGNYCVYIHTSPNGKMYVGQTGKSPEERWGKNGSHYLKKKKNGNYVHSAFALAILKYCWDNFEHEIVASNLTKEEANNFEKVLIEKLNTKSRKYGYNLKDGGLGGCFSEEVKKKISDATKGENNPFYGKKHSEESLKKMSESHKGLNIGKDHFASKKVCQYNSQGNLIKIWDCMAEAEKELNISNGSIYNCCKGIQKKAGDFIWRYADEKITDEYIYWCNELHSGGNQKKSIAQYSLDDKFICLFDSITEAGIKTGIDKGSISASCRGRNKTAGGFIWKYYNNENIKLVI